MKLFRKWELPPIGLRIIKSALGVLLCYLIGLLRGGQGIVFYSQLAVLWCIQDYISGTLAMARQRLLGTLVGALYGLLALFLFRSSPIGSTLPIRGAVIALMIVPVLYTTVLLKKKNASYFSCVVFLSIVVNHLGDADPYLFVWNRCLDTVIGIVLGVVINCFSLPRRRNRDILFVSGIDDTLLDANDNLSGFERVELNRMIEDGALFTVSTMRTPATIMESLGQLRLKLPAIVMDGAALYDFEQKRYLRIHTVPECAALWVIRFLEQQGQPYFANTILEDTLLIYYGDSDREIYRRLIGKLRRSPFRNYIKGTPERTDSIVYFMLIDRTDTIEALYAELTDALRAEGLLDALKLLKYPSHDYPGHSYIKLYDRNATRERMLSELIEAVPCSRVVTFGTIPGRYDHVISPGDSNRVVRLMKKEYEPLWKPWKHRTCSSARSA